MTKPDPPYDYNRRRAEDVFRALENEVFPRLGGIDTKIEFLEHGVQKLMVDGCAQRAGDIHRTQAVESSVERIFEKIDSFGEILADARVDMVEQVGAIKTDAEKRYSGLKMWIQAGVIVVLVALLVYFVKDYAHDIETHVGKQPATITSPR
jgi:hypothetical protein